MANSSSRAISTLSLDVAEFTMLRSILPSVPLPRGCEELFAPLARAHHEQYDRAVWRRLQRRSLVAGEGPPADPGAAETISPAVAAAFALHCVAESGLHVVTWTESQRLDQWISLHGDACAGIVLVRPRDSGVDANSDGWEVRLTLSHRRDLVELLMMSLPPTSIPAAPLSTAAPRSSSAALSSAAPPTSLPPAPLASFTSLDASLVESRALVAAIRFGQPRAAVELAAQCAMSDDLGLLTALAGTFESGFRLAQFDTSGRCEYACDWYLASGGWLMIRVRSPRDDAGTFSAKSLTEHARVSVTRVGVDMIRAELLARVAVDVGEPRVA